MFRIPTSLPTTDIFVVVKVIILYEENGDRLSFWPTMGGFQSNSINQFKFMISITYWKKNAAVLRHPVYVHVCRAVILFAVLLVDPNVIYRP